MRLGSAFSGIGLLDYGLHLAGLEHAWLCEVDPWRRTILNKRFPGVPVFDDIRSVGARTAEPVHVFAGGFPCKGASTAGLRNGFEHPETVLWREMRRAIDELRPRYVLVENVANILAVRDGAVWGEVLGDLAALGFSVVWDCLPAAAVGAPHLRDRVLAVAAHTDRDELRQQPERERGCRGAAVVAGPRSSAANAAVLAEREPADAAFAVTGGGDAREVAGCGSGLAVDWGEYQPAIDRWAAVHGPAPEPLVRRVDARSALRVDQSRLSALGDGVQVQCGVICGRYIIELERQRLEGALAA